MVFLYPDARACYLDWDQVAEDTVASLRASAGELTVQFETFAVNGAPGQLLVVYHAAAGSPTERALARLGEPTCGESAAATREGETPAAVVIGPSTTIFHDFLPRSNTQCIDRARELD